MLNHEAGNNMENVGNWEIIYPRFKWQCELRKTYMDCTFLGSFLSSILFICQCKFYKIFSRSVYILTKNRLMKYVHC